MTQDRSESPSAKVLARAAPRFKATTDSNHSLPVTANLLEQNSTTSAPDEKWVRDISYLWSDEGWLYLAAVLT